MKILCIDYIFFCLSFHFKSLPDQVMRAPVQDLPVETGIHAVTSLLPLQQVPISRLTGWPPAKLGQLRTSLDVPHQIGIRSQYACWK